MFQNQKQNRILWSCLLLPACFLGGVLIGVVSSCWLYPAEHILKGIYEIGDYPEHAVEHALLIRYICYPCVVLFLLEIKGRPEYLYFFWIIFGGFSGFYVRGLYTLYGKAMIGYGMLSIFCIPILLCVLSGYYWELIQKNKRYHMVGYQKRIRNVWLTIRIRLFPVIVFLIGIFFCYVLDREIIKPLEWKLLFRMFSNLVD